MKCPVCNIEAAIKAVKYVVEGDTSADEETKLYIEQEVCCRNPYCTNNGNVIKTVKTPLQLG